MFGHEVVTLHVLNTVQDEVVAVVVEVAVTEHPIVVSHSVSVVEVVVLPFEFKP